MVEKTRRREEEDGWRRKRNVECRGISWGDKSRGEEARAQKSENARAVGGGGGGGGGREKRERRRAEGGNRVVSGLKTE